MSQSPSLTAALEAVDRVFCAETGDLRELSEIAGIAPAILFLRADLSGLDLTGQNIEFLLPLETNYHTAILTPRQRRAFREADGQRKIRLRQKILDLRVALVLRFIRKYEEGRIEPKAGRSSGNYPEGRRVLSGTQAKEILLTPLVEQTSGGKPLTTKYINSVLESLNDLKPLNGPSFTEALFGLFGELQCLVDTETVKLLEASPFDISPPRLANIVRYFRTTRILDSYAITSPDGDVDHMLDNALILGSVRKVDAGAIEDALEISSEWEWQYILALLASIPFDCDSDQAERLAVHLTKTKFPSSKTEDILNAQIQHKVRNAVFRQLLAQGQEARVVEVIKWLDDQRGAAGALSLENAFIHITSFDLAIWLAKDLAPRLADNQIGVIDTALSRLALGRENTEQLASFRRRYVQRKS